LLLISIIKAFNGWGLKKTYTGGDRKLALFTVISAHLQLVIGLVLYFISPAVKNALADMGKAMSDTAQRFWAVEHISMMLLAIILITVGSVRAKKQATDEAKHKQIAVFFLIALAIIFIAIPWPWKTELGRGWMPGM
jgi:cation transport ATPase